MSYITSMIMAMTGNIASGLRRYLKKIPWWLGGKGKTPPEDIGGPHGFIAFKKAVNDPGHEEYHEYRKWLHLKEDEVWNRHEFNLPQVQHRLIKI